MKAIILASGKGTRLRPLTNTTPKPLIEIMGKPILEYNLECVYRDVDEIFIVVKYLKEKIIDFFGDNFKGTKITYIVQGDEKGTGAALKGFSCEDDVIILYGDSIISEKDIKKVIDSEYYAGLVKKVENPEKWGIYKQDENGFASEIIEKPKENVGNLANIGGFKFNKDIFEYVHKINISKRGEYEITDALNLFLEKNKFKLIEIQGEFIDISYPWDILDANQFFLKKLEKSKIDGEIEDGVIIKGNIILEKGASIKSGTYIEGNAYIGENTSVGPFAHLRGNNIIGRDCIIGQAELKDVIIGNAVKCKHFSYFGYSVIGNNVNIGGGYISADLRHDDKTIKMKVKGDLIDTCRRKLGVIIGDNVKTGIYTSSYPGRIIENDSFTEPGEIVR